MEWKRIKLSNLNDINWDESCPECIKHIELAKLLDMDLIFIPNSKHLIGVALKEKI